MNTTTSEKKAHSKFSASGSARWISCPGSIALEEKSPPQRESEYAKEGTDAHACLEFLLKNVNSDATRKMALKKYTKEQVEHAENARDWINGVYLEAGDDAVLLCETKVDASSFTCADQFGTVDAAIVEEFGRLTVIDYKYGAGIAVDPEENSQLIYYALGISNQYNHNFKEVELVVIQPRAFHESGETTRSVVYTMDELLAWQDKFKKGVKAALDPFAPLKSGSWCKFCRAAIQCPELKEKALAQAQVVFSDETGVESTPAPTYIPIKNLGVILDGCEKLEAWILKVREHAIHVLERGGSVDGFKLVAKRSPRRWMDAEKAEKKLTRELGDCVFAERKLLSPAQLEKVIKERWKEDSDIVGCGSELIESLVTDESSGTTLVRESDKRPAVRAIESVFSEVDESTGKEVVVANKRQKKKNAKKAVVKTKKK